MKKIVKHILILFLAFLIVFPLSLSGLADTDKDCDDSDHSCLSSNNCFTLQESVDFIVSHQIDSSDFAEEDWPLLAQFCINQCIQGNKISVSINNVIVSQFCKNVEDAFFAENPEISRLCTEKNNSRDQAYLTYSTLYSWNLSMKNYNCYSYVLGITNAARNPGYFYNSINGNNDSLGYNFSMQDIVDHTKNDLKTSTIGFQCVKVSNVRPTSVPSNGLVICARISPLYSGYDANNNLVNYKDYHFMKLSGGYWYHKPGKTAVLRYIGNPTNNVEWINEFIDENGFNYSPFPVYDSNIKYFICRATHNYSSVYTGVNFHKGGKHYYQYYDVCQYCEERTDTYTISIPCSGPPCPEIPGK